LFEFPCVRFTRVPNRYNSVSTTLCVSWYFNTNEQNQLELINTVWIWVRLFFLFLLFFLITQNRRTLLIHSNHLTKKHIFVIGLVKLIYSQNKTIDTCLVCFFYMPNVGVSSFQYDFVHPFDDEAMVQTSHGVDIAVVLFERGYPEVGWPWDWQCNDHFKKHVGAFIDSIDTTSQHMDLSYYHIDVVYFFSAGLANCTEARN